MPGLTLPTRQSADIIVLRHNSAAEFLKATFPTLRLYERSSHILLAHALKEVSAEAALTGYQFVTDDVEFSPSQHVHDPDDPFWLTLWSFSESSAAPRLDLALSCIRWTLGNYPIFIWTPHHPSSSAFAGLSPKISQLANHLFTYLPAKRVFSVFSTTSVTRIFAGYWRDLTGFPIEPEPFYAARLTHCTPRSLRNPKRPLLKGHLRKATMHDLDAVARLCKEFAHESVYFPLRTDEARLEGLEMISKGQLWVCEVQQQITTVCAVTRNSLHVSAITKVYTTPQWRGKGMAEHLVHYVTQRLFEFGKEDVVLYVGHDNNAQRVYDRVGFVGLCGKEAPEGVEDWLELGFVGADRGQW